MAIADIQRDTAPRTRKGPQCEVCAALETLPKAEADGLRALLADRTWRYSAIAERVREDPDSPLNIPSYTYAKHARGNCAAQERLR